MLRILFAFIILTLPAGTVQATTYYFTNAAQIRFRSDAPQEVISATSTSMRGLIDTEKKTYVFKVLMRTFSGFNSALQEEHFNDKFLESEKYPEAIFSGKIIEDLDFNVPGKYTIRAKGKLSIHGIEQERIITTEMTIRNDEIHFESTFTVLLADFNIKVPKVVHEKIASEIKVEVKGILKRKTLE